MCVSDLGIIFVGMFVFLTYWTAVRGNGRLAKLCGYILLFLIALFVFLNVWLKKS